MAGHFVPDAIGISRVTHDPNSLTSLQVKRFAADVQKRARRYAGTVKDTGALQASITVKSRFGPSGIDLVISAYRPGRDHSLKKWDVAMVIHQGHGVIVPKKGSRGGKKKGYLRFEYPKNSGSFVRARKVRAVGGVPFLAKALEEANLALPSDQRFRITFPPHRTDPPPRGAPTL